MMNRAPVLAWSSVAGLLALLVLLEAQTMSGTPPAALQPTAETPPASGAAAAFMIAGSVEQSWVRTILARPIFSPSRRPGTVAPVNTELPRLAGVIIGPNGASAIFASSDSRAIVAAAGMRAGPYLVRTVSAGGVSVIGPAGLQTLHVTYDPNGVPARGPDTPPAGPAGSGSILDLLRARIQSGDGLRSGMLPGFGTRSVGTPER